MALLVLDASVVKWFKEEDHSIVVKIKRFMK
jgi:hypothetical protein